MLAGVGEQQELQAGTENTTGDVARASPQLGFYHLKIPGVFLDLKCLQAESQSWSGQHSATAPSR